MNAWMFDGMVRVRVTKGVSPNFRVDLTCGA